MNWPMSIFPLDLTMSALVHQLKLDEAPSGSDNGSTNNAKNAGNANADANENTAEDELEEPNREETANMSAEMRRLRRNRDYACLASLATIPQYVLTVGSQLMLNLFLIPFFRLEELDLSENHIQAFPDSVPGKLSSITVRS